MGLLAVVHGVKRVDGTGLYAPWRYARGGGGFVARALSWQVGAGGHARSGIKG